MLINSIIKWEGHALEHCAALVQLREMALTISSRSHVTVLTIITCSELGALLRVKLLTLDESEVPQ